MHHQKATATPRGLESLILWHTEDAETRRHAARHTGTRNVREQARTQANSPRKLPQNIFKMLQNESRNGPGWGLGGFVDSDVH